MSPDPSTVESFLAEFEELVSDQVRHVDLGGAMPLPVASRSSPGAKTLAVLFHGAIDRTKRAHPSFLNMRPGLKGHAHQIAIADPSLGLSDELTNGWFAGSADTPLQRLLPEFLRALIERLRVDRIVFFGSSGGGFAALYYSWHFPGSVAVVSAPQTNVHTYYERRREMYLEACWPTNPDAHTGPCLDLKQLYSSGSMNTVVYIQSVLDRHHVQNHMAPFIGSLPPDALQRLVLKTSYWGRSGHSGAVPANEFDAWIRAAVASPSTEVGDLVSTHYAAGATEQHSAARRPSPASAANQSGETDERDLAWAALVAQSSSGNRS